MSAKFPSHTEVLTDHARRLPYGDCRCGFGLYAIPRPDEFAKHQDDMWREDCTIMTAEQLDALPLNSVVVDAAGIPRTKRGGNSHMGAGWTHAGNSPLRSTELADGRAMRLVWHPDWKATNV